MNICTCWKWRFRGLEDFVIVTKAPSQPGNSHAIVYVNDAFVRITGYSPSDALGRSPSFLQGKHTDAATIEQIDRAMALPKGDPGRNFSTTPRMDANTGWT